MRFEHWVYTIPLRMRSLFHQKRQDSELAEELRDHIDRQTDENLARGMSAEEARLAATRSLGNSALLRDQARETWGWAPVERMAQDIRYALRKLGRSFGFALTAVLILALGIGANAAIFQLLDAVRLRSLPVEGPQACADSYRRRKRRVWHFKEFEFAQLRSLAGNSPAAAGILRSIRVG